MRSAIAVGLTLLAICSCNKKGSGDAAGSESVRFYQDCLKALSEGDWEEYGECYAENAVSVWEDTGREPASGREAIVAQAQALAEAFPDLKARPERIFENGKNLASIYVMSGTHKGPYDTGNEILEPTGKSIGLSVFHVMQTSVDPVRITEEWLVYDEHTLRGQLGLSRGPHRPPGKARKLKVVSATGKPVERENLEVHQTLIDMFNRHDLEGLEQAMDDDYQGHDAPWPKNRNKQQAVEEYRAMFEHFPNIQFEVDDIWSAGHFVITRSTMHGQVSGNNVHVSSFEALRIKDGKSHESWLFYNHYAFGRQLAGQPATGGGKGASDNEDATDSGGGAADAGIPADASR